MPLYSYKERFVPFILEASKLGTIRSRRKKGAAKIGDRLYHYYGLRTKHTQKLGESICDNVRTVLIDKERDGSIFIYVFDTRLADNVVESLLSPDNKKFRDKILLGFDQQKRDALAWGDGFRPEGSTRENPAGAFDLMARWWSQTHDFPFVGDWITWKKETFIKA